MKKQNKRKWIRLRHGVVRNLLSVTLGVYTRIKYRVKVERFKNREKRQYLVLFNHQTAFDQFFVGMAFRGPVYYVATEDLFSLGFASKLISWLVAPIPIKKQANDARAVINCMRVAKEGGTIAIAPEGNRTYSGKTEYIKPTIVGLVRALKLPVALYVIEGGYGIHPRWSDKVRRGEMRSYVKRVIEYDEYSELDDDGLYALITDGLYVNEAKLDTEYKSKKAAEYLERAIYVCPHCGLSEFESRNDIIECLRCGRKVRYLPTKELCGVGFDFPFRFVNDWYEYQNAFINNFDPLSYTDTYLYREKASVYEVIPYKKKKPLYENAELSLFGNSIVINWAGAEAMTLMFDSVSHVAVLGKNKFNVYFGDKIYQIKSGKRFCAVKYVNIYYRYRNINSRSENERFLGI